VTVFDTSLVQNFAGQRRREIEDVVFDPTDTKQAHVKFSAEIRQWSKVSEHSRVAIAIRGPLELAVPKTAHVDLSLPDTSVQTVETLIKYELERLFCKKTEASKKVSKRKTFPKRLSVTYSDMRDPAIVEKSDCSRNPRSAQEDCHGYPVRVSAYWLLRH
jgi:hypothetical protein